MWAPNIRGVGKVPRRMTPKQATPNLVLESSTQELNSRMTHESFALPLVWRQVTGDG